MKFLKSFNDINYILEKSIGSESIRDKYYNDIPKSDFYRLVNIDPTSIRKKEFSKPGKYTKWLLKLYKDKDPDIADIFPVKKGKYTYSQNYIENTIKRINKLLFIFSTGWFKSKCKNNNIEYDIFKYKSFDSFEHTVHKYEDEYNSSTDRAKFDTVYSDGNIDILVPLNFTASYQTAKNTDWCTRTMTAFSMYNTSSVLFRLIPKNNADDKLKITWMRPYTKEEDAGREPMFHIACVKYPEITGYGNPFSIVEKDGDKLENWQWTKIDFDKSADKYNNQRSKDNSVVIEKTMNLLSIEAKKFMVSYYNKKFSK